MIRSGGDGIALRDRNVDGVKGMDLSSPEVGLEDLMKETLFLGPMNYVMSGTEYPIEVLRLIKGPRGKIRDMDVPRYRRHLWR